jgi:hypothetical protein
MRKGLFWLNDKQWAQIRPHQTGLTQHVDRHIISGIIHMLQCGARWRDCPPDDGPYTTVYNRFNRWAAFLKGLGASGLRISESCFATRLFATQGSPDADRV